MVGFSWVFSMYPRLALNSPSLFSFFIFPSTGLIRHVLLCLVLQELLPHAHSLVLAPDHMYLSLHSAFHVPFTAETMGSSSFWHLRLSHSSLALPIISKATPQPPTSHNHTNPILFHLGHVTCGIQSLYPKPKSFFISVIIIFSRAPNKPHKLRGPMLRKEKVKK